MFKFPSTVEVIANSDEEAKEFTENAKKYGASVKDVSVWTGPVPPNSFIEMAPNVQMASPEYMFLRKSNQLPFEDAVMVGCALLSCFNTCYTSPTIEPGKAYWREDSHTDPLKIINYLLPIIGTKEAHRSLEVLDESLKHLLAFDAMCEVMALCNE